MIILASNSLRRQELIKLITNNITIITADIDERLIEEEARTQGIDIKSISTLLALKKAEAVRDSLSSSYREQSIIIGADTSVILGDEILGKPENKEEAREMLHKLSGNKHIVVTGVAIISPNKTITFEEETEVEFMPLDQFQTDLIESYINTDDPYDKAGSYGIQKGGAILVKGINGDFFNVMGLPVARLARILDELNED